MTARAWLERSWWLPTPNGWMLALRPLSWLYRGLVALHRAWWTLRGAQQLPVPVVVIGNWVVGGAGKTPTTIALVRLLQQDGWLPGVVSRGYGRRSSGLREVTLACDTETVGDEPVLIHRRTRAPMWVGADRVAAAQALLRAHPEVNIVVSDDGLQHHRLARDLQVVVFDDRGCGNGLCLPAGPLRASMPFRPPEQPPTWVLYNATRATGPWPGHLALRALAGIVAWSDWSAGRPADPAELNQLALQSQGPLQVMAVAGIAAPERFFSMLERSGLRIQRLPLPDHASLEVLDVPVGVTDLVLTEKDAVKWRPEAMNQLPMPRVWVVPLDFALPSELVDSLRQALTRIRTPLPRQP